MSEEISEAAVTESRAPLPDRDIDSAADAHESPENLPPNAWVSLVLFAVLVVLASACISNLAFR